MLIIYIYYKNNKKAKCLLMKYKNNNKYSYINLTKKHICTCKFNTKKEALNDLKNYKNIKYYIICGESYYKKYNIKKYKFNEK